MHSAVESDARRRIYGGLQALYFRSPGQQTQSDWIEPNRRVVGERLYARTGFDPAGNAGL